MQCLDVDRHGQLDKLTGKSKDGRGGGDQILSCITLESDNASFVLSLHYTVNSNIYMMTIRTVIKFNMPFIDFCF